MKYIKKVLRLLKKRLRKTFVYNIHQYIKDEYQKIKPHIYTLLIFLIRNFGNLKFQKKVLQYEFRKEKALRKIGKSEIDDKIFDLNVWEFPVEKLDMMNVKYSAKVGPAGLNVNIDVPTSLKSEDDTIDLYVNDFLLRKINTKINGDRASISYFVRKESLEVLPKIFGIYFTLGDVICMQPVCSIINSFAIESKILIQGLDKKGFPVFKNEVNHQRQIESLKLYSRVNEFLNEKMNKPFFLLYGTLLGCYRDKKFIPSDDDFDAGYVSNYESPKDVKQELLEIIKNLIEAGFTVSINKRGRAFCIWDEQSSHTTRLDVRPVFFSSTKLWAHLQASLDMRIEEVLPCNEVSFEGVRVLIPKNSEKFLEQNYGKNWKIPDPAYSNKSVSIPESVLAHLEKYCFSVRELKNMNKYFAKKDIHGKLIIKPFLGLKESF